VKSAMSRLRSICGFRPLLLIESMEYEDGHKDSAYPTSAFAGNSGIRPPDSVRVSLLHAARHPSLLTYSGSSITKLDGDAAQQFVGKLFGE